jgi:hypothetical protein
MVLVPPRDWERSWSSSAPRPGSWSRWWASQVLCGCLQAFVKAIWVCLSCCGRIKRIPHKKWTRKEHVSVPAVDSASSTETYHFAKSGNFGKTNHCVYCASLPVWLVCFLHSLYLLVVYCCTQLSFTPETQLTYLQAVIFTVRYTCCTQLSHLPETQLTHLT